MTVIDDLFRLGHVCYKQTRDAFQPSRLTEVILWAVIKLQSLWWKIGKRSGWWNNHYFRFIVFAVFHFLFCFLSSLSINKSTMYCVNTRHMHIATKHVNITQSTVKIKCMVLAKWIDYKSIILRNIAKTNIILGIIYIVYSYTVIVISQRHYLLSSSLCLLPHFRIARFCCTKLSARPSLLLTVYNVDGLSSYTGRVTS